MLLVPESYNMYKHYVTCSKFRMVSMSSLAEKMQVFVFGVSPSIDTPPPGTEKLNTKFDIKYDRNYRFEVICS